MRVVELVAGLVAKPEPVAADRVQTDEEQLAVRDGEHRRADRREDVVPVVPAGRGSGGLEVVVKDASGP